MDIIKKYYRKNSIHYYEISAEENYNLDKPFLWFARKLTGDNGLHFIQAPALRPPETQLDMST